MKNHMRIVQNKLWIFGRISGTLWDQYVAYLRVGLPSNRYNSILILFFLYYFTLYYFPYYI